MNDKQNHEFAQSLPVCFCFSSNFHVFYFEFWTLTAHIFLWSLMPVRNSVCKSTDTYFSNSQMKLFIEMDIKYNMLVLVHVWFPIICSIIFSTNKSFCFKCTELPSIYIELKCLKKATILGPALVKSISSPCYGQSVLVLFSLLVHR